MNKLTKIGVSALAGSLALTAANAIEMSVSGSAGGALATGDENGKSDFYQFDSVVFTASGETDGGITVSAKMELDNDNPGTDSSSNGMDDRSFSFGTDSMGTVSFHGHGGSSVMGQWDDITPNAYEEVWDGTTGADVRIDGRSGNNLLTYDSPSFNGVMIKAAHVQGASGTLTGDTNAVDLSAYTDFGIQVSPEMVEGLTLGYAEAEMEDTSSTTIDHSTYFIKYTVGGLTAAYQDHEADGPTAAKTDESQSWAVSYAVSDNLTIAYGERDYNDDTSTDTGNSMEQNDSGFSASYTMGGMTIAGHMNTNDNVGGNSNASADKEAYEFALSFAF
ncbi:porin [Candidatus Pelagibacter sp.]|nr:porin [Candidatus Pelagibacter sp.]